MSDFSNLVGKRFFHCYDNDPVTVHGAYFHDGQVQLIVSRSGGPLFISSIDSLRSEDPDDI